MREKPIVSIVVPCYNEENVVIQTSIQLSNILNPLKEKEIIDQRSYLLFVDDGSRDQTWDQIEELTQTKQGMVGLKLSRNVGHQKALMSGLLFAKQDSDCVISIDADLQDDEAKIVDFIEKYKEGYEIVYGVRSKRELDTFFKRHSAQGYYSLMKMMGVELVYNHADYRLLSKKALDHLEQYQESNLFLRGIIPMLGLRSTQVYYDRKKREMGESKYPLFKMLSFAFDGITSFSVKPIRLVSTFGFVMFAFSLMMIGYFLYAWLTDQVVTGWTSTIMSLWFIGGIQLMAIGLVGEYIGKVFQEAKHRPKYFIETVSYSKSLSYEVNYIKKIAN